MDRSTPAHLKERLRMLSLCDPKPVTSYWVFAVSFPPSDSIADSVLFLGLIYLAYLV